MQPALRRLGVWCLRRGKIHDAGRGRGGDSEHDKTVKYYCEVSTKTSLLAGYLSSTTIGRLENVSGSLCRQHGSEREREVASIPVGWPRRRCGQVGPRDRGE